MNVFHKTIAVVSLLTVSLAAPITILAATAKATPTESPVPTIEATVAPTPVATPAPQSATEWVMTHKKIDLGILIAVAVIGYGVYRQTKKDSQATPQEETKTEEEPEEEDQTPPGETV